MRAVIQRVSQASVIINGKVHAAIDIGLLVFIGIEEADRNDDIEWLAGKILRLRIFDDEDGVMNKSVVEVEGKILVVSQFTLHASTKKGNRPSYIRAARPEFSNPFYIEFINFLKTENLVEIKSGIFAADMQVELTNIGPVTILIDTKNKE
jgi:D-tyrosyl-tRNA(Tyr) deacylase